MKTILFFKIPLRSSDLVLGVVREINQAPPFVAGATLGSYYAFCQATPLCEYVTASRVADKTERSDM